MSTYRAQDMAPLLESHLSDNIALTPEGYLVCINVPLSRTGIYQYKASDLKQDARDLLGVTNLNQVVDIHRLPEDVFDSDSLRSIESKPVIDDHTEDVNPDNYSIFAQGHARNIRHDGQYVIGDLVITNASLIRKIRNKEKLEVSLGYDHDFEPHNSSLKQTNIRINHIAIVERGRAGHKARIHDSVKKNRSIFPMRQKEALALLLHNYAKDASPEDFLKVSRALDENEEEEREEKKKKEDREKDKAKDSSFMEQLAAFMAGSKKRNKDALTQDKEDEEEEEKKSREKDKRRSKDTSVFDALRRVLDDMEEEEEEKEKSHDDWEENHTPEHHVTAKAAYDKDDDEWEDEEEKEEERKAREKDKKRAKDSLRRAIAELPEKHQQRIKDAVSPFMKRGNGTGYSDIIQATRTKDTSDSDVKPMSQLGADIAAKFNPHYKKA